MNLYNLFQSLYFKSLFIQQKNKANTNDKYSLNHSQLDDNHQNESEDEKNEYGDFGEKNSVDHNKSENDENENHDEGEDTENNLQNQLDQIKRKQEIVS